MKPTVAALLFVSIFSPAMANEPTIAEKLSILLDNAPSARRLQSEMDEVLTRYGVQADEEGRSKLGNVLLGLQKDGPRVAGYETLSCMLHRDQSKGSEWVNAAALCAVAIRALNK